MTEKVLSKKEKEPTEKILTGQEFFDLIYRGDSLPQDNRFIPFDEGGVFKYFLLSNNLINIHIKREDLFYPTVWVDNKIVALAELKKSPHEENLYWIEGVSVDPAYQGKGYASMVLEEVFRLAKNRGVGLLASRYSDEGLTKLKSVCHKLADKYEIEFRESSQQ